LSVNGTAIFSGAGNVGVGQTLTGAQVAAQINLFSGTTGVTASVNSVAANGTVGAVIRRRAAPSDGPCAKRRSTSSWKTSTRFRCFFPR